MRALLLLSIAGPLCAVEFNRDVRPILSDRCYFCHGPDNGNRKANLRLDRRPDEALLPKIVERITTTNKVRRMPPAYLGHDALKPAEIEILRQWVSAGAPYQQHWSFIPPKKQPVPAGINPIDHFVRQRLASEGLRQSPAAPRATLLRRVTLDLTGLPPSPAEIESFLMDTAPDAYEKVIDRLFASPRYAERMAIRWLEAARYADTNGYQTDGVRSMWRWRDWVLDAFRRNMPFDRFTVEQIAGDLLPSATRDQLIATGFHRNHRTSAEGGIIDEEFRVEYVADRAETTSTVWLGLTAGCARCHDHKYDPISQKEFYQLFSFFNQVPEKGFVYNFGNEEPYVKAPTPDQEARLKALESSLADARRRWDNLQPMILSSSTKFKPPAGWLPPEALVFRHPGGIFDGGDGAVAGFEKTRLDYTDPFTFAATVTAASPDGAILSKAEDYWEGAGHGLYLVEGKLRLHIVFRWTDLGLRLQTARALPPGPHRLAVTYDGKRKPSGIHIYVDGVDQELEVLFNELSWPMESKEPFRIGAGGGKRFKGEIRDVAVWKRALSRHELDTPFYYAWLDLKAPKEIREARAALQAAQAARDSYEAGIQTVMVMRDAPQWRKTYLLKRGVYDAPGEEVRPAVPAVLPQLPAGAPRNRLGLARWLVSRENPLTARVTVNRLWQMIFGAGLVRTVEDFGSQGEWPHHPELLDWLAVDFLDSGWNIQHVLKTILLSETYRQESLLTRELAERDPENRLYARGPRVRLAAEMIRDQALFASGLLVEKFGGPSVNPYQPPGLWQELAGGQGYEPDKGEGLWRRSLYTYWRRTIQPPSMVTFDSPTRETCVVRETRTNTPLQALNLMNDPTYLEAARRLGQRMAADTDPIAAGFRLLLARDPLPRERDILMAAFDRFRDWTPVASLLLNLDETVTKE
jgi:hypothetical protein